MGLVSPAQSNAGDTIEAADINTPVNQLASVINGNIDTNNIAASGVGTNNIANGAVTGVKMEARPSEYLADFVYSGCVVTVTSGLGWSMTTGVVYIGGKRLTVSSATGTVTASKDTYFDVLDNGDGTGVLVNTGGNIVTTNTASPTLAASSIRIAIVVAGASITSINQGSTTAVAPVISSTVLMFTDSLGNIIYPADPNRRIIGYRQITAMFTGTGFALQAVTGLSVPVIIPAGSRKVKITVSSYNFAGGGAVNPNMWDGVVSSGTQVGSWLFAASTSGTMQCSLNASGSKTYNLGITASSGTVSVAAFANAPAFIMVELI